MSKPDSPQQSKPFDSEPLSWVMVEIREALGRSKTALFEAGGREREERATALQHARSHLHQAHGALVMVDVAGASLLTDAAEQALARFRDGSLEYTLDHAQVVAELYQALGEYLEDLVAGTQPQPARLFPYYRDLQTMLGAERIHPADLFFPPASPLEGHAIALAQSPPVRDYPAWRGRFEKSLLPFLKAQDDAARRQHAGDLHATLTLVADAQQDAPARTFWFAMQAFAGLAASGEGMGTLNVKQLFGLINLQLRRLAQGTASLPESMLRDALFFIAAAHEPTPEARQLRAAFALEGMLPADVEARRYGQVDQDALQGARAALAQARASWSRLAQADLDPALGTDFDTSLQEVAAHVETLKQPALASLLRECAAVARQAVASGRSAALENEIGMALLFADTGLEQLRRLPDDFAGNAETIAARLQALLAGEAPPPVTAGELSRQIEQGQTVAALAEEMKTGLRQVEKVLNAYYADAVGTGTAGALDGVAPVLEQLQQQLAGLAQEDARAAVLQVDAAVRQLAGADAKAEANADARAEALDEIAQNVSALGFFADMLGRNAQAASGRFHFDAAAGTFRALPFEKVAAAGPVPLLDQALAPAAPAGMDAAPAVTDVDAEMLDIFIAEAREVLAFIDTTLALPREQAASGDHLAMLRRSFHTLKGSSRMIGLAQFAEAAGAIERVMNTWLAEARPVSDDLFTLLNYGWYQLSEWVAQLEGGAGREREPGMLLAAAERVREGGPFELRKPRPAAPVASNGNVIGLPLATAPALHEAPDDHLKHVGDLRISLPLYNIYLAETDELLRVLTRDFGEWRHEQRAVSAEALQAVHTLAGTSGTVGFQSLRDLAHELETVIETVVPPLAGLRAEQHDVLEQATQRIGQMLQAFALGDLAPTQPDMIEALNTLWRALTAPPGEGKEERLDALFAAAYASIVGAPAQPAEPVAEVPPPQLETLFEATYASIVADALQPEAAELPAPVQDSDDLFDAGFEHAPPLEHAAPEAPAPAIMPADAAALLAASAGISDELDLDLLSVFLEEGADLLPRIGEALRSWQQQPHDSGQAQMLLRTLHTVKGSARMAGAMRLGQHAHEIETHIENMLHAGTATPQAFEELLAHYDHALHLFEQLQQPLLPLPGMEDTPAAEPKAALVRVRADILDRLVNQAGEVSITRSKMENEVGVLGASLSEFSDNLARLRRQLREVEMQAESQIASRMAVGSEREFDPLEFDRFTRLQELTRMMAESVNDVASFHENLRHSVDAVTDDLVLQARLTRELQRDLMQIRMVPFASIAERLFRVARQSAKEVDKRVNLDIRGGGVEIDRSVLERMAAPFEHLLRNAIVHGVEPRDARLAAGKSETGELLVQVSQQGNEVAISFSDDGAGLDLERIRAKAHGAGLVATDAPLTDAQAAELIFTPGFSTADSLTELAGRGFGMDIVRSEALALGGRVETLTQAGLGMRFTIHLPLTLAVTQVVLLAASGKTYALPSVLVEQVLHLKGEQLEQVRAAGRIESHGQSLALHHLSAMLGETPAAQATQRHAPVLLLRNGNDRLALQVDDVLGNREVVVKHVGPQLARMPGIAGATVLGTGDIVLILNPVALAQHLEHHPELLSQYALASSEQHAATSALEAPAVRVMVVDDSLTVRRVMQRLFEREGYQVMLAKDGLDALEQLHALEAAAMPAMLLVDVEMPRMDGFDLTRNVRSDDKTRAIPVIMITSRSADKHRAHAFELGVNAYFGKPFQEDELLAEVGRLLSDGVA
ncbi:chemosensory pili system protein ChpA (sensor histidine kinase/response regulator) [Janthinobacterium sp. OK676]|uniref:hybrid sensor histidine kinase/response regulator n=1 Tax=Janthinobacterium sp. OK676 TaxID=1855295 RepID=UPI00087E7D30|nr:Hpt domain-containing protein [Janthinobacterium sp. OK676]SDM10828.1 chemosensory pili system protein ChpA (sensor histidine kinase/response regulator) [Janthinobacterium sp. OK676]